MKRRELVYPKIERIKGVEIDKTSVYHPLTYYIDGGVDLTGEALKKDAHVEYDDEKSTTPKVTKSKDGTMDYGAIDSCALCDPRISHFDIVEQLGAENAQKAFAEMETPLVNENEPE